MADKQPKIDPDLKIKFKGASKHQKNEIAQILISNYTELVNNMVKEADYAKTTAYWSDFIPCKGPFISAKEFIKKYKK